MTNWIWLLLGVSLGTLLGIALANLAMTRVWRAARRLNRRSHGREHLVEIGQLAAGLAHEIKNPLSTINVNLTLLAEDIARFHDDEHARLGRRLHNVQSEAHRLRDILDDFLRFAGKYELSLASADLRRIVEELADFFGPQAQAVGVVLRMSLPDEPVTCRVDENLLKQAILNLMINAVQAMPGGGELLLRVCPQRRHGVIEVIDTGPGIEPAQRQRIFEAYFSTKKGGTGLGLPTTRRIVHEHGGQLRVESESGKGTRFVIELPLA
jgi:signal transduction histidine kinase